jgi:hypothetical protein
MIQSGSHNRRQSRPGALAGIGGTMSVFVAGQAYASAADFAVPKSLSNRLGNRWVPCRTNTSEQAPRR